MAKVTWIHKGETLTDNTQFDKCRQCKDCAFWDPDNTDASVNAYDKGCCLMYREPEMKPMDVIWNRADCKFRRERPKK